MSLTATPVLEAALEYAARGWAIFPVSGKRPQTARGFEDASSDPVVVERLFTDVTPTGVAVACGASGLLVVDLDGPAAAEAWAELAARHGGHSETLVAQTGKPNGLHLYFAGEGRSSAGRLGPGIDTRGRGGYVVAPPSWHPSGAVYRWLDPDAPLAPAPAWLLAALEPPAPPPAGDARSLPAGASATSYGRAALEGLAADMLAAPEGQRNEVLVRVAYRAGRLVAAGELAEESARAVLVEAARRVGLSLVEADRTYRSGFTAGLELPAARARR